MADPVVAGMDGCRAGWFVVLRSRAGEGTACVGTFAEALEAARGAAIAGVDMPVGLLDAAAGGGRPCDRAARALLGGRHSCVFSPPVRSALNAPDYRTALTVNRASSPSRIGITLQSFNIFAKLAEVDAVMRGRPGLQRRIKEVHPELAFLRMHGEPGVLARKKSAEGRAQRLRLLEREGFTGISGALESRPPGVGADDVLDAYAVCWSAWRIATGSAVRIPARPERDAHGLFMEIWH